MRTHRLCPGLWPVQYDALRQAPDGSDVYLRAQPLRRLQDHVRDSEDPLYEGEHGGSSGRAGNSEEIVAVAEQFLVKGMKFVHFSEYSVLMSVYHKEKPEYLRQAMESIYDQTVKTNDFILVCDGPLNEALDKVIAEKQQEMGNVLHVVRLAKNGGLGNALNEGIKHCRNELIARMDSDDISYPDRCERQLKVFQLHPEISICSGIVEEFSKFSDVVDTRRIPPETSEEIRDFAKKRNPFNHPCVMYKKSAIMAVGSYQDFYLLEDYYLWLRMLMAGNQGYNLQEPLLHMRAGVGMYKRRGGWQYFKTQRKLFTYMKERGFIGEKEYIESCFIRGVASLTPNWMRKLLYTWLFRK